MKLIIIRHGQTDGNVRNMVQGAGVDLPLNANGRHQAEVAAEKLLPYHLSIVYSSTMIRACQTAEIIASRLGCPTAEVSGLEEVHFGDAEGMSSEEARRIYKDVFDVVDDPRHPQSRDVFIPNGESINQSTARGLKALETIRDNCEFPVAGVVTHGSLMFNLYHYFFGQIRRFDNCEFFELNF